METNFTDHDLLITLHEQVKGIRTDIGEIRDDIKSKVADHEHRIRTLEKRQWLWSGMASVTGAGLTLFANYLIKIIK